MLAGWWKRSEKGAARIAPSTRRSHRMVSRRRSSKKTEYCAFGASCAPAAPAAAVMRAWIVAASVSGVYRPAGSVHERTRPSGSVKMSACALSCTSGR